MKKYGKIALVTVAIGLLAIGTIPQQSDAYTWYSNREDVAITSVNSTIWANLSWYYNTTGDSDVSINITLLDGLNLTGLGLMNFTVYNNESGNVHANLTVNTVLMINNTTIATTANAYANMSNYTGGSGERGVEYINLTFNCSENDVYVNISLMAQDFLWTNNTEIATIYTVRERYKTQPEITLDKDDSHYAVSDKVTFTIQNTDMLTIDNSTVTVVNLTILNATCVIDYPAHKTGNPIGNFSVDALHAGGSSVVQYVDYQKNGPYVKTMGDPQLDTFGDYEMGWRIKAYEAETDADWTFDPASTALSSYFPDLDTDTLTIEVDSKDYDFTLGSIVVDDVDLDDGLTDVEFKWTPLAEPVATTEEDGTDWMLIGGMVLLVCAVFVAVIFIAKKR